jgi:TonB family protein
MKSIFLVMTVLCVLEGGQGQQKWDTYITSLQMPCYPPIARAARVQGTAKIKLVVAGDGSVTSAVAVEGHALLAKAAIDNVRTWKFSVGDSHAPLEPLVVVFQYKLEDGSGWNRCAARVVFHSWSRVTVVSNFNPPLD